MSDGVIDPYQIDDAKNNFIRATAMDNYRRLIKEWMASEPVTETRDYPPFTK